MRQFKKLIIVLIITSVAGLSGCSFLRGAAEMGSAHLLEDSSMELVLDRINTAAMASKIAHVALNNAAISADVTWPGELEEFNTERIDVVMRTLALDGAYAAHGGIISPIKAHVAIASEVLYRLPPDMYAAEGTCYIPGEETVINGIYYQINSHEDIIEKRKPSAEELKRAVAQSSKAIFVNTPCNAENNVVKRYGLLRPQAGTQVYRSIMDALQKILPNGKQLKTAWKEYDGAKRDVISMANKIGEANTDIKRIDKNETPVFFKDKASAEEAVKARVAELEELEKIVEEKEAILDAELDRISECKAQITDERELKTLKKVVEACEGVEGLLVDSISLAVVALSKMPQSVMGLPSELQRIATVKGPQAAYLPLRMARLRFNLGNSVDNVGTIIDTIRKDSAVVLKIHSEVSELIELQTAPGGEDVAAK